MAELNLKRGSRIRRNGRTAKVLKVKDNMTALIIYEDSPKQKISVSYTRLELEYEAGHLEVM